MTVTDKYADIDADVLRMLLDKDVDTLRTLLLRRDEQIAELKARLKKAESKLDESTDYSGFYL